MLPHVISEQTREKTQKIFVNSNFKQNKKTTNNNLAYYHSSLMDDVTSKVNFFMMFHFMNMLHNIYPHSSVKILY